MSLPRFCNPQAFRIAQDDPKHEEDQQAHRKVALQDGPSSLYSSGSRSGRFCGVPRPERCLFPRPNRPLVEGSFGICRRKGDFSLQSSSFRTAPSSQSFHQGGLSVDVVPQGQGPSDLCLLRRLASRRQFGGSAFSPSFAVSGNNREFGIHDQLVQIGIHSLPNSDLLGRPVGSQESTGSAESREGRDSGQSCRVPPEHAEGSSRGLVEMAGSFSQSGGHLAELSSLYETFPATSPEVFQAESQLPSGLDSFADGDQEASLTLDEPYLPSSGKEIQGPSSLNYSDHGRVTSRLGGPLSRSDGFRILGPSEATASHQRSGTFVSSVCPPTFPRPVGGPFSVDSHGQHLCEGLHQQTRRDTLFGVEQSSVPPLGMVQSGGDHPGGFPHSGGGQSDSGFSIPRSVAAIGMDVVPSCLRVSNSEIREPGNRSVCNLSEQQTSSVLLPSQGDFGFRSGRVLSSLEGVEGVRLSTIQADPSGSQKDQGGSGNSGLDCSPLAGSSLVSGPVAPVSRGAAAPSGRTGLSLSTFVGGSSCESIAPSSHCMASIGQRARDEGFSDRAAELLVESRRKSTRIVYNSRLEAFFAWCEPLGVSPREAPLPLIADFLISLFDKGRSLSTIRGFCLAI